jgi:choice-of-anchor B domain-containing protein
MHMGHATNKWREIGVGRGGLAVAAMVVLAGTPIASAQGGWNVTLLDTLAGDGSDCWGYVSASGREYALVSNRGTTKFVEITDPTNIVVIDEVLHPSSLWGDIKTYGDYAYAVAESSGSGIQVFDLSDIDNGNVAHVRTVLSPSSSHNVVIDTDSGFMYLSGGAIFSLANPASPVRVGTGPGWHDAQVVTYTSGVYAGKEILFGAAGSRGLEIYDVSDKGNPVRLSLTTYPMLGYCHQGWLSDDRQYFYANDEFDESNNGITTRTLIFDVSDLSNPTLAGTFTTGLNSIDHNLYYKDGFLFEANYTSGLRVIDACDPVNLVESGYYDTYSPNNGASFNGAWSVYPFFPSGVCIINNIGGALYVVDPSAAVSEPCHTGCPCACDMDSGGLGGVCDIFDFLAFQNGFVAGESCSCNFDVSTGVDVCDIFDFLAFQDDFAGGIANCR